jgi:hypothetical protein
MAMHDTFRVKHAVYRTVPCSYRVVVVTKTCTCTLERLSVSTRESISHFVISCASRIVYARIECKDSITVSVTRVTRDFEIVLDP